MIFDDFTKGFDSECIAIMTDIVGVPKVTTMEFLKWQLLLWR